MEGKFSVISPYFPYFYMTKEYSAKEIAQTYFTLIKEEIKENKKTGVFECKCGNKRTQLVNKGYTNLASHVISSHPDYLEVMASRNKEKQAKNPIYKFVAAKSTLVFNWLELVIELNLPFTFVESRIVRKAVKYEDISVDTLQKYLELVTQSTEKKVAAALPAKFGLIIDGWSEGNQHYFGLYAAYDSDHYPLLAFAPPIDEESYSAENQAAFITDVLELFGRRRDDVLFLVADNTNVNPATARLLGCSFIGCASHRFNLAVKEYMLTYEEKLDDIQSLMKKLLNLKIAGALRRKTDLKPVIRNVTRWSSTYSMLKRFLQLKDILVSLNHPEVNEFLPDGRQVNS